MLDLGHAKVNGRRKEKSRLTKLQVKPILTNTVLDDGAKNLMCHELQAHDHH